jgi:hypothetical protein
MLGVLDIAYQMHLFGHNLDRSSERTLAVETSNEARNAEIEDIINTKTLQVTAFSSQLLFLRLVL